MIHSEFQSLRTQFLDCNLYKEKQEPDMFMHTNYASILFVNLWDMVSFVDDCYISQW